LRDPYVGHCPTQITMPGSPLGKLRVRSASQVIGTSSFFRHSSTKYLNTDIECGTG
jgi:hypothetical protein